MLKTKLITFITGLLLFISTSAFCGDKALFPANEFKLGYEGLYMYYDEPNIMHEKGYLNGGFGSWTGYFTEHSLMIKVEAEAVGGSMRYDGKYSDGTKLDCNTDDFLATARATIGLGIDYGNVGVTPYLGIGGRYWYDKIKAPGGYERRIKQLYLPIGFNIISRLDDKWSLGGTLEGDLFLGGQVESELSQVGSSYEDASNTQNFMEGGGARISAFVEYDFESCALGFEPYFRYWQFEDSKSDTIRYGGSYAKVIEPENKFFMSGIRLYVRF